MSIVANKRRNRGKTTRNFIPTVKLVGKDRRPQLSVPCPLCEKRRQQKYLKEHLLKIHKISAEDFATIKKTHNCFASFRKLFEISCQKSDLIFRDPSYEFSLEEFMQAFHEFRESPQGGYFVLPGDNSNFSRAVLDSKIKVIKDFERVVRQFLDYIIKSKEFSLGKRFKITKLIKCLHELCASKEVLKHLKSTGKKSSELKTSTVANRMGHLHKVIEFIILKFGNMLKDDDKYSLKVIKKYLSNIKKSCEKKDNLDRMQRNSEESQHPEQMATDGLQKFLKHEKHLEAIRVIGDDENWRENIKEIGILCQGDLTTARDIVYNIGCHLLILLAYSTGQRPGVYQEVLMTDIRNLSRDNPDHYKVETNSWHLILAQSGCFKTVKTADLWIGDRLKNLLDRYIILKLVTVPNQGKGFLFETKLGYQINSKPTKLLKDAWQRQCDLPAISYNTIRHGIVTVCQSESDKREKSRQEGAGGSGTNNMIALAKAMMHNRSTANRRYNDHNTGRKFKKSERNSEENSNSAVNLEAVPKFIEDTLRITVIS